MFRFLKLIPIFIFGFVHAQEEAVKSVYFEFDKFSLDEKQAKEVVDFIKNTDSTRIESIQIFGYTDDIGKDAYNFKLSTNRATTIQKKILDSGIKSKIIVTIEGKGRILIDDDIVDNLPEKRSKNRRVDVVLNLKELPKLVLPGFYNMIQKNHVVGDHIYLENILFDKGSSHLMTKAKTELDKVAKYLKPEEFKKVTDTILKLLDYVYVKYTEFYAEHKNILNKVLNHERDGALLFDSTKFCLLFNPEWDFRIGGFIVLDSDPNKEQLLNIDLW
jgi:outer membrane protein OmpA-like peptidoglycan-associated protein